MKVSTILSIATALLVVTVSTASSNNNHEIDQDQASSEMSSQPENFIGGQLSAIIQNILDDLAKDQADQFTSIMRYAGMGYNLLQANPEGDFYSGGEDPGIKKARHIFQFTENSGKRSFYRGKEVTVPDQVVFHASKTCAEKKSTHAYSGQTSYRKGLSYNVDASGSYSGIFQVRFSLSSGMQKAKAETELNQKVVVQHNKICNYGSVRYLLENALNGVEGFELTDSFKNAVKLLPSEYLKDVYARFIDDWGTDIIQEAKLGTRKITRSRATYNDAFKFLNTQTSNGASLGGKYIGVKGDVSFNVDTLDQHVTQNSKLGKEWSSFTLGSKRVPVPIFIKTISIETAFQDVFWSMEDKGSVQQKKILLRKALADYPEYRNAHIDNDPTISIKIQWPDSQFSLPEPASGCPQGWSTGWRYQDTENERNDNSYSPNNIDSYMKVKVDKNIQTHFCTKTKETHSGFVWPKGTYCIARYGGKCPKDFTPGFRVWDDEDTSNGNYKSGTLPDGKYDHNTKIKFCCRSDGRPSNPAPLPTKHQFILYQYQGQCQEVAGMSSKELMVYWDNEDDKGNIGVCSGEVPTGRCGHNQALLYCYYYH